MSHEVQEQQRFIGRVKWFNNKNGYGFLAYTKGDIFVHHSAIVAPETQFKFLVEGEYVEFTPVEHNGPHNGKSKESRWTAYDVTGPLRGQLMCQTQGEHWDKKATGEHWDKKAAGEETDSLSKSSKRFRGGGPRSSGENITVGVSNWKLSGKSCEKFV